MKNEKTIKLYVYVDGVNDVPFYGSDTGEYEAFILANGEQYITSEGFVFNVRNVNEQIEIGAFRYDAKRMGGAPTISCTLMYEDCLDDFWSDNVYAKFNGEKYYLKQTPTSSYNNESTMYKHDLELVSERVILDNVYFFDTVVGDPQGDDKPVSNSTNVVFFGNIHEFVKRLNSSLEYAKLLKWEDGVDDNGNAIKIPNGYHVVVDDDNNITKEEKLMSFEDQFFSNVLQEIYKTYEVPYYFEGKTIHIGYSNSNAAVPTFSYGVDDALLSITKNNANYKIINRATATGSSDNIPFYYPNNSPKGEIAAISSNSNIEVTILDTELYSNEVKLDGVITRSNIDYENLEVKHLGKSITSGETFSGGMGYGGISKDFFITFDAKDVGELSVSFASKVTKYILKDGEINDATFSVKYYLSLCTTSEDGYPYGREVFTSGTLDSVEDVRIPIVKALDRYRLRITVSYAPTGKYAGKGGSIVYDASFDFGSESGWNYEGKSIELKDVGLKAEGTPSVGDTITQKLVKYVKTSQNLMPSIYRETDGAERFYNATNGTYEGIEFNNPYVEGRPKEHIFTVEDIKPTIEKTEVTQPTGSNFAGSSLRIDMFSEFAYDDDDNDETYEDEEGNVYFKHPYFYGKLRVMDFNLFDHAIENQPMTISFTSGHCGACNFEIGVTEEYPQKNPVQVYEADTLIDGVLHKAGSLKRDENGMVLAGVEGTQQLVTTFQERQQDTSKYEVWIALRKEEETYGILMPKASKFNEAGEQIEAGHRPKAAGSGNEGDTFVILGINLPQSYIIDAEKKLEAEIIKYLQDNNDEKFTFSVNFSRIYFEENNILDQLSENSKIRIIYDNKPYDLYVSSFSYSMSEGDVLPEIRVELDETLKVSQNALQNAISQVKSELGRAIGSIDVVGAATPYFIRKDADDEAQGRINFKKGIKFGEGGKVEVLDNNSAKLTIEYLEVTKKASFTSLEIQEKTHVGGQILVTPAAINCGEVEEFDDYYRCYFQTKGTDGDEIFNQFAVGDQAICQTYNAWGSRYYWRLVTGIGEDYIDLSKVEGEYDEDSDAPMAGDKIIQLGNQTDSTRQNAIVISAYGDNAPSLIMYNGINDFTLVDKNITGIVWNPILEEPQLYSYGSFFFGDRQLNKNFIAFQKKEGDTDKNLYINGKVTIGAGSEGLSNLEEWSNVQNQIDQSSEEINNLISDGILDIVEKRRLRDVLISICEINPSTINNYATDYLNYSEDNLITNPSDYVDGTINSSTISTVKRYDGLLNNMNVSGKWHLRCRLYGTIGDLYRIALGNKFIADDSFTEDGWKDFDLVVNYSDTIGEGFLFLGSANISGNQTTGVSFTKEDVKIKGSLIDWYRRCIELDKGGTNYQDTYGQNAFDRAIDLYEYLEQYDIWNDTATTVPSDFSSKYQKLLNDYNESITTLNYKTSGDDIEYLKNAFKDGKTILGDGVVMSEVVAVKNKDEEIEGILNGSNTFRDTEHGKIILASGIPSISSSGSTKLADRVNESKSKIFEDGTITTKAIELGRFKLEHTDDYYGWTISSDYVDTQYSTTHRISMDSRRFLARSERKQGNNDVTSQVILNPSWAGPELIGGIIDVFSSDIAQYGINISTKSTGIVISSDENAIRCQKGLFAGLRPMSRTITSSTSLANRYLSPIDHTIFIPDSATDIYLPSSPLDGQEYVILVPNGGVNIYGNGKTILLFYDGVERQSFTCGDIATRVEVRLYWNKDDDKWWATFIKH